MAKKLYPASEGWLRATFTMNSKKPLGEGEIKKLAAFRGDPADYEWALVEQYGAKIKVIYRNKRKVAA